MLQAFLALAVLFQSTERPEPLVHPDERATYTQALQQFGARAVEHFTGVACPGAAVAEVGHWPITLRDVLGTSGPVEGLRERVQVDGCGQTSVQNLIVARPDPDASWQFTFAVPGESILQFIQQDHVQERLKSEVEAYSHQDCSDARLIDTYVMANPGRVVFSSIPLPLSDDPSFNLNLPLQVLADNGVVRALSWAEVWMFDLCGYKRAIGVVFMPTLDRHFIVFPVPMDDVSPDDWPKRATPRPAGELSNAA